MSKMNKVIAAVVVGLMLLVGGVYPTISQPQIGQPVSQVTPTPPALNAPPCGGNSCGG
jgi:hypothetical protein